MQRDHTHADQAPGVVRDEFRFPIVVDFGTRFQHLNVGVPHDAVHGGRIQHFGIQTCFYLKCNPDRGVNATGAKPLFIGLDPCGVCRIVGCALPNLGYRQSLIPAVEISPLFSLVIVNSPRCSLTESVSQCFLP